MIEYAIPEEFQPLAEVQDRWEDELLDKPNVVGVALGHKVVGGEDTGEPAITVLVDAKIDEHLLADEDRLGGDRLLDDVRVDVQEVGVITAGPESVEVAPREHVDDIGTLALRWRLRPAMGGFSVGHYRITAGTIATGCYDAQPFPGIPRAYYLLSNNHVLADSNDARIGDPVLQPGPADGGTVGADTIGRLARFVPIRFRTLTTAPRNFVDAALAEVDFQLLNREVYWIGYVRRMYDRPVVGDIVQKTGRTTNFTTGSVTNINATVDVNYGGGRIARFARQILTTAMSAPGDSGSLVTNLAEQGVGLLFAGSSRVTVLNDLRRVQALLGVRITER